MYEKLYKYFRPNKNIKRNHAIKITNFWLKIKLKCTKNFFI